MQGNFLNLPNWITIGRLIVVPFLIVLMLFLDDKSHHVGWNKTLSFISGILFIAAMTTDMLDGYLARKRNIVSTFGKFLDPLADKMIVTVAMIMMIPLGRIPAWIVALFFIREVTVTALRGIAVDEGIVIEASQWGKYKSALVSVAISGMLLHYPFFGVQWRLIGWLFLWPAFIFAIGSGLHYSIGFFREIHRRQVDVDKAVPV